MGSFGSLEIGFSFLFGGIFLGFVVAELYYVLWWKKRRAAAASDGGEYCVKGFSCLLCWRKPSLFNSSSRSSSGQELGNAPEAIAGADEQQDLEVGSGQDSVLTGYDEEAVDSELIRLHNLSGPPRFLFTIKEENREDLESEDGKSRDDGNSRKGSRTRSLSHDLVSADGSTPFFTPMSSPSHRASPIRDSLYGGGRFNPFFEPLSEAELNRLRSSPPPTFKFMRDAEDKYLKRLMEEAGREPGLGKEGPVQDKGSSNLAPHHIAGGKNGFLVCGVEKRSVRGPVGYQSAQVIPLT